MHGQRRPTHRALAELACRSCSPFPKQNRQHANFDLGGVALSRGAPAKVPGARSRARHPAERRAERYLCRAHRRDDARRGLCRRSTLLIGSGLLLLITVGLAVWGLRRGLQSVWPNLREVPSAISTSNWELNPSEAARDTTELAPLTQAMTTMLDGLHRAFDQQREFLANAAHELKTPVAILKSTLQSLLQRPAQAEEYRAGLEQALDDMARLEKLLHSMLRLARAEQWAAGSARRDLRDHRRGHHLPERHRATGAGGTRTRRDYRLQQQRRDADARGCRGS